MRLFSTGGHGPAVSFREALLEGQAPDGGLYVPASVPVFTPAAVRDLRSAPFMDLAAATAVLWLHDEYDGPTLDALVRRAMEIPVPLVELAPGLWVLELFHGPTLAFKDFGARFLARVFGHELRQRRARATVLVATSGDTGGAVAHGFHGVPGVDVVVLYPRGRVSAFQEAQIATVGGNVTAVRVPGSFDDCQRLVKGAFRAPALVPLCLSSANSISFGRLLPQSFYYLHAGLAVEARTGRPPVFVVPSGNLGNLTAGVLAWRMGAPVGGLVAATNVNAAFPEYLASGRFSPRPSVATLSNAMDVGNPSNVARVVALFADHAALADTIAGDVVDEDETRDEIRRTYREAGYVLDPHGAVACRAARRWRARHGPASPIVVLATAHPAKFADAIAAELGRAPDLPPDQRDWRDRRLIVSDLPDTADDTFTRFLLALHDRSPHGAG